MVRTIIIIIDLSRCQKFKGFANTINRGRFGFVSGKLGHINGGDHFTPKKVEAL